jgi:uncharacterized protein YycO
VIFKKLISNSFYSLLSILALLTLGLAGVFFMYLSITLFLVILSILIFIATFISLFKQKSWINLTIATIVSLILFFGTYQLAYQYLDWLSIKKYEGVSEVPSIDNTLIKNGDIIFQTSKSNQSKAIQLATKSKYSHMGMIYQNDGKYFVYEAVQPVKLTSLPEWINRGENKHYVIKRLKNADKVLTQKVLTNMRQIGEQFKGKAYDIYFEWSDEKIYCSELVWKIYKQATNIEIGQLEQLSDFDLSNEIVKAKMKERYGDNIPMDEKLISPAAMFNSDKLITIEEK